MYILAAAFVAAAVVVSYFLHYQMVGIILFIMGVLTFILPSMRGPRRL